MKEDELIALLNDLSLEEKVMQLVQLPGREAPSGKLPMSFPRHVGQDRCITIST